MRTLLIGGARSGKSALAQRWAAAACGPVCALVTGRDSDPEMAARIAVHRRSRPAEWLVREEPINLAHALAELLSGPVAGAAGAVGTMAAPVLLIDCLTLWVSNCLWPQGSAATDYVTWHRERAAFLSALSQAREANIIIVSNEVGTGIVPDNAAARLFRDEHGWLNQAVAAVCDQVYVVTAGLSSCLKPAPPGSAPARI